MRSPASYLRSLDPGLSRAVWTLQLGGFANAFGNGMVSAYLLIYLHNVRGISLGTAGLCLASMGVAALAVGPAVGALVDRLGGRAMLVVAMVVSAAGFGGYALVHHPWQAYAASVVAGTGNGVFWPASSRLVAALTERETRHSAYAMQRVSNNLGIGLGGLAGGLWLVGAGMCVAGGLGALALERRIPLEIRRTPRRVPIVEAAA